jgi:glutamate racemase
MTDKAFACCDKAIGLFDSGLGGLTVLRALKSTLPHENFIYFGDTARVPYGGKSRDTVLRYSMENARFLLDKDIKLLIVACNTATAYALGELQKAMHIPVIGVIEAGADAAVQASKSKKIAILGTRGTITSSVYQKEILKRDPSIQVEAISCPLFVPLVEERFTNHPAARLIVQEYLSPLQNKGVDTILLGCTHYPLLKELIQQEAGEEIVIVDSAVTCAQLAATTLHRLRLVASERLGDCCYHVSDDPAWFKPLAEEFLGEPVIHVEKTHLGGLCRLH